MRTWEDAFVNKKIKAKTNIIIHAEIKPCVISCWVYMCQRKELCLPTSDYSFCSFKGYAYWAQQHSLGLPCQLTHSWHLRAGGGGGNQNALMLHYKMKTETSSWINLTRVGPNLNSLLVIPPLSSVCSLWLLGCLLSVCCVLCLCASLTLHLCLCYVFIEWHRKASMGFFIKDFNRASERKRLFTGLNWPRLALKTSQRFSNLPPHVASNFVVGIYFKAAFRKWLHNLHALFWVSDIEGYKCKIQYLAWDLKADCTGNSRHSKAG